MSYIRNATGLGLPIDQPRAPVRAAFQGVRCGHSLPYADCIGAIVQGAMPHLSCIADSILGQVEGALKLGSFGDAILGAEEIARIQLYTAQTDALAASKARAMHEDLNARCYHADPTQVAPYVPFIWSLLWDLRRLPPYAGTTVFRGVKLDLKHQYAAGQKVTWHGFSSATKSREALDSDRFLGKSGPRTVFAIELCQRQARDISEYSFAVDGEVLLAPGTRVEVTGVAESRSGLTVIYMTELESAEWILDLDPGAGVLASLVATPRCSRCKMCARRQEGKQAHLRQGEEEEDGLVLWHGTTEEAALRMRRQGHLRPSRAGFFGPGVYLTGTRRKAEAWARYAASGRPICPSMRKAFLRGARSRPALVKVRAAPGKSKVLRRALTRDELFAYDALHPDWGFSFDLDDNGRLVLKGSPRSPEYLSLSEFVVPGEKPRSPDEHACERVVRHLSAWIQEGYDSQYVPETMPEHYESRSLEYFEERLGTADHDTTCLGPGRWWIDRMVGDEWVLRRGDSAVYMGHEVLG